MPNQRAKGHRLLTFQSSPEFERLINGALKDHREFGNRSDFIRNAIAERLDKIGVRVPPEISGPPVRIGKGGKKK